MKEEKEKKEAIKNITKFILSVCKKNKKITTATSSLLYQHNRDWFGNDEKVAVCFFTVERSIKLCLDHARFFGSMRNLIFMCISFFAKELKGIYSTEEDMQEELKEKQIKNQKLSDSEFFEKTKFIDFKISIKKQDTKLPEYLQKLGFLDTDHIQEYKNIFLLFDSEVEKNFGSDSDPKIRREKPERKNPDNSKDWEAKDGD